MEVIAEKTTVCPYCNSYIVPGQEIAPYAGQWYHSACQHNIDFSPRSYSGTVRVSGASRRNSGTLAKQRRSARNERILKWHRTHSYMSVRELSEYLGESKSTVHRVLQEQAQASRAGAFRALAQQ